MKTVLVLLGAALVLTPAAAAAYEGYPPHVPPHVPCVSVDGGYDLDESLVELDADVDRYGRANLTVGSNGNYVSARQDCPAPLVWHQ